MSSLSEHPTVRRFRERTLNGGLLKSANVTFFTSMSISSPDAFVGPVRIVTQSS